MEFHKCLYMEQLWAEKLFLLDSLGQILKGKDFSNTKCFSNLYRKT